MFEPRRIARGRNTAIAVCFAVGILAMTAWGTNAYRTSLHERRRAEQAAAAYQAETDAAAAQRERTIAALKVFSNLLRPDPIGDDPEPEITVGWDSAAPDELLVTLEYPSGRVTQYYCNPEQDSELRVRFLLDKANAHQSSTEWNASFDWNSMSVILD